MGLSGLMRRNIIIEAYSELYLFHNLFYIYFCFFIIFVLGLFLN